MVTPRKAMAEAMATPCTLAATTKGKRHRMTRQKPALRLGLGLGLGLGLESGLVVRVRVSG